MSKRTIEAVYPLSPMQQGMLFHSMYAPESGVYVEQVSCTLRGQLDVAAFEQAWQRVVERHTVLRTAFALKNLEKVLQVVQRGVQVPLTQEDWRHLAADEQQQRWADFLENDRIRGLDLSQAPVMRLALMRTAADAHLFLWTHHHIVLDGWSLPILLKEVLTLYEALRRGVNPALPPARPYRDYIAWLQKQDLAAAEAFWRQTLAGFSAPTSLGVERAAAGDAAASPGYVVLKDKLPAAETAALQELGRRYGLTLNTLFQGAWALLLNRYSGDEDIVFGATVSGRPPELPGVEQMVGLFINTLPVRIRIDGAMRLSDWLAGLQAQLIDLRQYEYSPLVQVQEWSQVPRGQSLFESIVVFENYPVGDSMQEQGGSLRLEQVRFAEQTNYPLTISSAPGQELMLEIAYETARFDPAVISRMVGHLQSLLSGFVAGIERPLAELSLLSEAERNTILQVWGQRPALQHPECAVHELIAAQAARAPQALALVSGSTRLSYAELDARANQLAHHLLELGVTSETLVAIVLEKSADLITAVLATHKAGGAYVPVDPGYPAERIAHMLNDAQPAVVITQAGLRERLPAHPARELLLDADAQAIAQQPTTAPDTRVTSEQLAYVIYTSGSTGQSKGVLITHHSLVNQYLAWQQEYALSAQDIHLQMASFSFDVFAGDYVRALCAGATLVLCPRELLLDPASLLALIEQERVSCAEFVPAVLRELINYLEQQNRQLETLRLLACGSDSWFIGEYRRFARRLAPQTRLVNSFGLTEATIDSTYYEAPPETLSAEQLLPIGRPFPGTSIFILDQYMHPVPAKVKGELCIAGAGLARGYLNRPELTAERFVQLASGQRIYRSGDAARWAEDGTIEFLGRLDYQVKIRGYRIEPGEIEAVLSQSPEVREAVVVAQTEPSGSARLVAYLVPAVEAQVPDPRGFLKERLPEYMLPSAFVVLERLPLLPNGKVDRKALPVPDLAQDLASSYVAPRNPEEELLANIWAQLLNVPRVGAYDSFFDLGGHSLLASRLVARIRDVFDVELPLRAVFETPTVARMAMRIGDERRSASGLRQPPIVRVDRSAELPLSFSQQRLWFLDQLEPESPLYNTSTAVRLSGLLDLAALEQTINTIVARHESLRTVFTDTSGRPSQVILPELSISVPLIDLSETPGATQDDELRRIAIEEARRPFNLSRGPLLRVSLLRLAEQEHIALVTIHHIVSDGWSAGVFIQEVAALYTAFVSGRSNPLPELPIQYADYAVWQREWLQGETLARQLDYWKQTLAGIPEVINLPTDRPRPPVQSFNGDHLPFGLSQQTSAALVTFARNEGVTPFMVLLAAFQSLLYRYSGQDDICVGTPIAGRTRAETEGLIGFFVNTLVIRTILDGGSSFRDLLGKVRDAALGAYAHQEVPFEMLVEVLQPARNLSHSPLFQVMLVLDNTSSEPLSLPGLTISPLQADSGVARFEMVLVLTETLDGLQGSLEYNTDLFDRATMERFLRHFEVLLAGILAAPETTLDRLPLLTEAERQLLLVDWNQTASELPALQAWHQLFEQQARSIPDAPALRFLNQELSYAQLDARANQLARHLRTLGVGPEVLVGICTARSLDLVVGMLGTLKAGGAFLPLDPAYPVERLAFMLADARPKVVLTQHAIATGLGWIAGTEQAQAAAFDLETLPPLVLLDAEWPLIDQQPATAPAVALSLDQLAYVIFTSGSTGRPKGALLHHRGLLNLALAQQQAFAQQPGHRILQFSALSFDASVWEVVMALSFGATLVLAPQDLLASPPELLRLLRREQITTATLPPSLLAVLPADDLPDFTTVVAAGEACSAALVASWSTANRRLFNAYGPTETTVCATMQLTNPADPRDPPIGRPLPNFRAYVLDTLQQPVPLGVPGELVVSGIGVARGYLNRPELTQEKFIPDPAGHAERAYRTGDLVRYRPDGTLEFLGRIDHQVKLRGFRIELGEIEAALRQQDGVQDALVLARELAPGDTRLVAYLVGSQIPEAGVLRSALRTRLPEFMLPAAMITLDAWPLTPSGKIDRRALPAPDGVAARTREYVAPRTEVEAAVAVMCAELLGVTQVGVTESFFELGGHSLLATQLLARVREQLGVEVPLRALFDQPTVAGIAERVEELRSAGAGEQQAITDLLAQVENLSDEEVLALLAQQQDQQ